MLTVQEAVPAEPGEVRRMAVHYDTTAADVREVRTELRAIAGSVGGIPWEGLTAVAFAREIGKVPLDVDALAAGYEQVAGALRTFASELYELRADAVVQHRIGTTALARLTELRPRRAQVAQALDSAQRSLDSASSSASSAAADTSPTAAANQAGADAAVRSAAAAVQALTRQLRQIDAEIGREERTVARATRALEQIQQRGRAGARRTASEVRDAKKDDDGFLERLAGGAVDALSTLGGVGDVLVDAVGDAAGAVSGAVEDVVDQVVQDVKDAAWQVGQFAIGVGEATWGMAEFAFKISPAYAIIDPSGYVEHATGLAKGIVYGVQNPKEFAKALLDWETWKENPARALGHLVPDLLLTLATAGAGGAGVAATRTAAATRKLDDLAAAAARAPRPRGGPLPDLSDIAHPVGSPQWADEVSRRYPTLTSDDAAAVFDYTTNEGYTAMNTQLRSGATDPAVQARIDATAAALDKMPTTPGTTYRGTHLPDDVLADYQPGNVVSDKAFTSTTANPDVARGFGPIDLVVEGRHGVDVQPLSRFHTEAEVLYPPGTPFEVLSRAVDPSTGRTQIELREVTR